MSRRRLAWWSGLWLLGVAIALWAQPRTLPAATYQRILRALGEADLQGGWVGLVVARQGEARFLLARHPDHSFMPASNMKLITSAAALSVLGGDFRFQTRVGADTPPPPDGTLPGSLYLVGGADPSLEGGHLKTLAKEMAALGLREVRAGVVGDGSLLEGPAWGYGWNWDDLPWYYAPELSGLCLDRNQLLLTARPAGKLGEPVEVALQPPTDYLPVRNDARTGPVDAGGAFRIWRLPGESFLRLGGFLPLGSAPVRQACSLPTPALFAAHTLTAALREAGVKVGREPGAGEAPTGVKIWRTHRSAPLRDLLQRLNKQSDNLYAEQVLRMVGIVSGKGAEPQDARDAVFEFLQRNGFSVKGARIADGSGLSRFNLVSPRLMAEVLQWLAKHREGRALLDSLPVAGRDGTLSSRLKGTVAEGNVRAKTGTLGNVRCLSGYVTTADGVPLVFVCLVNHYTCPRSVVLRLQDEIVLALAECRWRE